MGHDSVLLGEPGPLTIPDVLWERTKLISAVIALLANRAIFGRAAVDAAASSLGVSQRQVYVLINRYRDGSGLLTALAPGRPSGVSLCSLSSCGGGFSYFCDDRFGWAISAGDLGSSAKAPE